MREYLDFDLLVEPAEPAEPGAYRARVLDAPAGETPPAPFRMPFSDLEVENFLLRIGFPRRQPARGDHSPQATAVREFGGRLFDAVFHDELRVALDRSLDQVEGRNAGLRLRLRLSDCPDLVDLPWEYLYHRGAHRFLALSEWTPVVRYLQFPGRVRPLHVAPPLQVLVLIASPTDFPPLDTAAEWTNLHHAVGELERAGRVRVERVPTGTLADLQRHLRRGQYHVFHYIGHGGYDPQREDGVLALEGPTGRGQLVSGQDLGVLLHDHRTLRLAVLNSCEGARGGRTDPYSGTAQSLLRQGIPAVVAMQFEISDQAAITLSRSLYEAVADGYPLDAALGEARKAVHNQPNPVEWGTPVLYLRAPDGRIFDVESPPATSARLERAKSSRTDILPVSSAWVAHLLESDSLANYPGEHGRDLRRLSLTRQESHVLHYEFDQFDNEILLLDDQVVGRGGALPRLKWHFIIVDGGESFVSRVEVKRRVFGTPFWNITRFTVLIEEKTIYVDQGL